MLKIENVTPQRLIKNLESVMLGKLLTDFERIRLMTSVIVRKFSYCFIIDGEFTSQN